MHKKTQQRLRLLSSGSAGPSGRLNLIPDYLYACAIRGQGCGKAMCVASLCLPLSDLQDKINPFNIN
jgi:hypothetical protein